MSSLKGRFRKKAFYTGAIKVIINADSEEEAQQVISDRVESCPDVVDWGFARTSNGGRAFLRKADITDDFIELKDKVKADDQAPPASLDVEDLERDERNSEYEKEFDRA